jgi:hypothetical protein
MEAQNSVTLYSFQSGKNRNLFALTPDAKGANLPSALGPWSKHKEVNVNRGEGPRIGADSDEILEGINRDGFFIGGVKVSFTESVVAQPPKK